MDSPTLPELVGALPDATVITRAGRRSHRLGKSAEADNRWTAEIIAAALEQAEQTMVSATALDPDLIDPRHVVLHGLALTSTGEGWRWCRSHSLKYCLNLSRYLVRKRLQELDRLRGPRPVIVAVNRPPPSGTPRFRTRTGPTDGSGAPPA
jgi:hypothetical protein